jgi:predicted RND superfamily exporter protein
MIWTRIATTILKNRTWFVIGILTFLGVMGFYASKVELEYTMHRLVPSDDPDAVVYENFKKKFGEDGNKLIIALETPDLFELKFYNEFRKTCDSIKAIEGVSSLISPTNLTKLDLVLDKDSAEILKMTPLLDRPAENQNELDSISEIFYSLKFYDGLLYNSKNKVSLIVVSIEDSIMNTPVRIRLIEKASKILDRFSKNTDREVHLSGLPYVRYINATIVKDEILLFTICAFLVTAILIFILFRSWSTLLISLLFIVMGVLVMFGVAGMLGYKLNVLTGTLPPLLVVIGVQNTIYLINQYHDQYRRHGNQAKALLRIISHVGVATFLINFTTAVGFGTFYFTDTVILEHFGVLSFITINIVFFLNIIGIPILYSYLPTPSQKQIKHLDNTSISKLLLSVQNIIFKRKRRIFYWFSVLSILGVVFLARLRPLAFMVDDIPHDSQMYQDMEFIQNNFSGAMPYEILISSYEEGGVTNVDMLSKGRKLQRALKEIPELSKPMSIVELVSAANQAANDNDPRFYRIPPANQFGELLLKLPQSSQMGENKLMRGLVDSSLTQMRISYQMKDVGSVRMDTINNQISKIASDIFPSEEYQIKITGTTPIFLKGNKYLYSSLLQSTFWGLLIISLTMTFLFPSWRMIFIAIIPNIVPLLITAGIMGYLGVPLKPSTILIFSIAFGITVDATIHFVSTFRREVIVMNKLVRPALVATINEVGLSLIYTSLAICFGFAIFIFSDFQGTQSLGWLTVITILIGMFSNLLLLPALILAFEKFINPKVELKETLLDLPDEEE